MLFTNAHDIIQIRYHQQDIQEKFPYFLRFCKTIMVENTDNYEMNDIFEDASIFLEDAEELSPLDYEFYETLREGNVITDKESVEYIRKEIRRKAGNDFTVYNTQDGYIIHFNQRVIYVDDVIRTSLKLYYRVDDKVLCYVESLFYAILEQNLNMNEITIYNYTTFIQNVISNPNTVLSRIKKSLREFAEIEEVKEFLERDMLSDTRFLSYTILEFLYKITEKIRKSPNKSNQLYNYLEIFKAVFSR